MTAQLDKIMDHAYVPVLQYKITKLIYLTDQLRSYFETEKIDNCS